MQIGRNAHLDGGTYGYILQVVHDADDAALASLHRRGNQFGALLVEPDVEDGVQGRRTQGRLRRTDDFPDERVLVVGFGSIQGSKFMHKQVVYQHQNVEILDYMF